MGDEGGIVEDGEVGGVHGIAFHVSETRGGYADRANTSYIIQNGEVMHSEIPEDVCFPLKETEIYAYRVVVMQLAQVIGGEFFHLLDCPGVGEGVIDH